MATSEDLAERAIAVLADLVGFDTTSRGSNLALIEYVEAKLKEHDKIKALVVVDDEFISYTPQAAWADTKLGVRHWSDFRRIALVTDTGWIAGMAKLFAPLMPAEFKAFPVAELDAAKH